MNGPSQSPGAPLEPALKPDNWNKDRCDNCAKQFIKTKPNRRFCSEHCQKEYHRYGAAYGPLKDKLEKLIEKRVAEHVLKFRAQLAAAILDSLEDETFKARLAAAGFIHRSQLRKPLTKLRLLWEENTLIANKRWEIAGSGHSEGRDTKESATPCP